MTRCLRETLNKWIPFMVRQAHHERNQQLTVRPRIGSEAGSEPVEGLVQCFLKLLLLLCAALAQPAMAQDRSQKGSPAPGGTTITEQRIALVIGNSQYKDSPLTNPVNDARAIAKSLAQSGFKVIKKENVGQKEMQVALREFGDGLKNGGVGLFYYAGHGMQVKGRNFLIPVDAQIQREDEVAYNSVDAGQVLDKMEAAGNRLNIVVLDACRNNPFARSFRSGGAGLAQMDAPVGTLVAFATAPGSVASDGDGQNGLYTQHLLQSMQRPGVKIEDVFKNVRAAVRRDSQGKQVPWESTSLEGDFIFVPQPPAPAVTARAAPVATAKIDSIAAPQLQVGDTWTYQLIDMLSGSVIDKFTRRLTNLAADEWRFGGYITDKSMNLLRRTREGKVTETWTPRRPQHDFPMQAGKTWSEKGVRNAEDRTTEIDYTFKVVRQEQVIVPAGVFDTLRVEGSTKYKSRKKKDNSISEGTGVHRYWFSPATANFVAYEFEEANSKGVVHIKQRTELLSYNRDGKK